MNLELMRNKLPGRKLVHFNTIDTTMREAARLAAAGEPSGTTVVADEQTAGQGRHGHSWHSEKGYGLYVSIVLRLDVQRESLPLTTLVLGLATSEAIARAANLPCDLRWPNDVMLNGRKVAGILVQLLDSAVVAGIGININQESFPCDLENEATSLLIESGHAYSREDVLIHLLQSVDGFCRMLENGGAQPILNLFAKHSSYAKGKRVVVKQGDSLTTGTTAGLNEAGFLVLRKDDGSEELILAGGVRAAGSGRG